MSGVGWLVGNEIGLFCLFWIKEIVVKSSSKTALLKKSPTSILDTYHNQTKPNLPLCPELCYLCPVTVASC